VNLNSSVQIVSVITLACPLVLIHIKSEIITFMPHRNNPPAKQEHFLRDDFTIGATLTNFDSLKQLKPFAREAYDLAGIQPWTKRTAADIETTEEHLRGGFIGTVSVESAVLLRDEPIIESGGDSIDGLLIELAMLFKATGNSPIHVMGGLALGNGPERFEIRAYDLEHKTFGKISNEELEKYLTMSKSRSGGTKAGASRKAGQRLGKSGISSS
jgi:hypothetical protein